MASPDQRIELWSTILSRRRLLTGLTASAVSAWLLARSKSPREYSTEVKHLFPEAHLNTIVNPATGQPFSYSEVMSTSRDYSGPYDHDRSGNNFGRSNPTSVSWPLKDHTWPLWQDDTHRIEVSDKGLFLKQNGKVVGHLDLGRDNFLVNPQLVQITDQYVFLPVENKLCVYYKKNPDLWIDYQDDLGFIDETQLIDHYFLFKVRMPWTEGSTYGTTHDMVFETSRTRFLKALKIDP